MADNATDTYILEDEEGNEYEIDAMVDPKVAADRIRQQKTPAIARTSSAQQFTPSSGIMESAERAVTLDWPRLTEGTDTAKEWDMLSTVGRVLAPVAADVATTALLPESVLLKLARIPGIRNIVSKWGPEMLRRLAGASSGTLTAGVTSGIPAAVGYAGLSMLPPVGASMAETSAGPAASAFQQTLSRGTGGAVGGAAGTTVAALAERGQLPGPLELALGTGISGAGEAIAGAPAAIIRRPTDPRIQELKTRFPELMDIPDAVLMDPSSDIRRWLDSIGTDPLANPVLAGAAEDVNRAAGDIARRNLGVTPPAQTLAGEIAPNLDPIRSAADEVIRGFEVAQPSIAESSITPNQVVSEMTSRLDVPQPLSPAQVLPQVPPATIQGEGVAARKALQARRDLINEQGQAKFGRMMDAVRTLPTANLPVQPLQAALKEAKDIAGPIIIPENRQGAMRTAANMGRATMPLADADELAALSGMFPELMTGFGNEAAELTNLSKLTVNQAADLLKGLSRARSMYSTRTGKKIINTLMDGVWNALEQSDMPPEVLNQLRSGRVEYAQMAGERDVIEKALRRTKTNPEILGRAIRRFNPEEMAANAPGTIFGSLTAGGYDVKAGARNLLVNNLSRRISRATPKELPALFREVGKSPLMDTPAMQAQADAWDRFLANPENEKRAKQYLDVLTGGGPSTPQQVGKQATDLALTEEATIFAKQLPQPVQEAIGRSAARNILARSVKPQTPVAGGPQIMVADPVMINDLQKNFGGISLLPRTEQEALIEFAARSPQALNDANKVADTIAKIYEPGNYSGMANLFRDYFKGADPRKITQVRDLLSKVPGGKQAWEDFATSQLSTNIFEGNDFSAERVIMMFEDAEGKMIPQQTLNVLTSHLPKESQDVLQELYDVSKRILNIAPGRANPLYSALRTGSSVGKTMSESTGVRSLMTRVLPTLGSGIVGAGAGRAALGAIGGAVTSLGSMAGAVLAPEALGKALLSNGETLRRTIKPVIQQLENIALQATSGGAKQMSQPTGDIRRER